MVHQKVNVCLTGCSRVKPKFPRNTAVRVHVHVRFCNGLRTPPFGPRAPSTCQLRMDCMLWYLFVADKLTIGFCARLITIRPRQSLLQACAQ